MSAAARHLTPAPVLAAGAVALDVVGASDPGSTRLVYAMVAGLAVIGVGFIVLGVWLIRRTRVEPPVLGPLERMGERDWKKRDLSSQRRLLDEVRPPGAVPLRSEPAAPTLDTDFDRVPVAASLADLGPGVDEPATAPPEVVDPTPTGADDDLAALVTAAGRPGGDRPSADADDDATDADDPRDVDVTVDEVDDDTTDDDTTDDDTTDDDTTDDDAGTDDLDAGDDDTGDDDTGDDAVTDTDADTGAGAGAIVPDDATAPDDAEPRVGDDDVPVEDAATEVRN